MAISLPPFPEVTEAALRAIARRHGVGRGPVRPLPQTGIFNRAYGLGERAVLRVPRRARAFIEAARKESVVVPIARAAGVSTPRLLAYDDACDLLPVPYTVYEMWHGTIFERREAWWRAADVWRAAGADLARLHATPPSAVEGPLRLEGVRDPAEEVRDLVSLGHMAAFEARALELWIGRLRRLGGEPEASLLHGDVQAANIMVNEPFGAYMGLLDWGGAGFGDRARDFAGVPLDVVPWLLQGYRSLRDEPEGSLEARILLRHLDLSVHMTRRGPMPDTSWAERPLGGWLALMRFFSRPRGPAWQALAPFDGLPEE